MSDELRAILERLPSKRAYVHLLVDARDKAVVPAMGDLWAYLAAELAEIETTERATFDRLTADCWTPRR